MMCVSLTATVTPSTCISMIKRRISWANIITVCGAAVLIGTEVFGAGFAGGWALASLIGLGTIGTWLLQGVLLLAGIYVMALFFRRAWEVEPFIISSDVNDLEHGKQ